MVFGVWLPVVLIGLVHYATDPALGWVHDVARRLYYLPIVLAATYGGLRAGLLTAVVVSLSYVPHAFAHLGHIAHRDPADTVHKALEIVLYFGVGAVAGVLSDRERHRRIELERALEEQQRLQHELVRAGRLSALGEVVAGVAHEIKNPLHSLKGTAEIVDPLIPPTCDERRMWDIHIAELDRLQRIADRFVSFAKPAPPQLTKLDLRDVIAHVLELVAVDARKRGIELESQLPERAVWVHGDRDQLAQVALNLTLNAMRAAPQGGHIRVGARRRSQYGELWVENDGPPIPEGEFDALFDPFHAGPGGGTGLGLSISARIVEQHLGFLEAQNAGLGVRFLVRVPESERS